jgi:predicted nucleic acid-binding protein
MKQYILDTNIWLDWLVYNDPALTAFIRGYEEACFSIVYTTEMLTEFAIVIRRAAFKRSKTEQKALIDRFKSVATLVELPAERIRSGLKCHDPADQIYLDAAFFFKVDGLISKDKMVLALKNKAAKHQIWIGTPLQWLALK